MEIEDCDSVELIPESPPIYSEPNSQVNDNVANNFNVKTIPTKHTTSSSFDLDLEDEIVDYDDLEEENKLNTTITTTDVVIDIMDFEEETSVNQIDQVNSGEPLEDEEDDLDLLAQVEEMEKSFNNGTSPANVSLNQDQPHSPSNILLTDSEEFQIKEQERRDEVNKLSRLDPNTGRIFPDVRPSNFHTVAFSIKSDYIPGDDLPPHPPSIQTKWDPQFVPMPFARQNTRVFKIRQQNGSDNDQKIPATYTEETVWMWKRIDDVLSVPMLSCQDIAGAMKHYCRTSLELKALNYAIESIMTKAERENFFSKVLPCMQTLCLDTSQIITCSLPLLVKFTNYSISLSQKQIACLLANAFFSTFPRRLGDESQYPSINFIELFQCAEDDDNNSRLATKAHKIRCILNYFARVADEMPKGVVTYTRRSIRNSKAPDWQHSTKTLSKIIPLLEGTIEDDGVGMLQVDFANKMIGGGVLGGGAVQEEILFVIYPELLLSRLFTEKLTSCEALIVTGSERFCSYSGYARNFRYDGDFYDVTPFDSKGRRCSQFVAIDALYITRPITQFHPRFLTREMNKAFVGFSSPIGGLVPVATGKWGCGAFNGNPQLKAILQLLAASQAGRDVVFFTFGDVKIQKEIEDMYSVIKDKTIQGVFNFLSQYYSLFCVTSKPKYTLCEFFLQFGNSPASLPILPQKSDDNVKPSSSSTKVKEVPITKFYSKIDKPKRPEDIETQAESELLDRMDEVKAKIKLGKDTRVKPIDPLLMRKNENVLSDEQIGQLLQEPSQNLLDDAATTSSIYDMPTVPIQIDGESKSKSKTPFAKEPDASRRRVFLTDFYK